MKVLVASRSVAHFPYFRTVVEELEKRGHKCTILFDHKWSTGTNFEPIGRFIHSGSKSTIQWMIRRSGWWRRVLFLTREIRTYLNYDTIVYQSPYYKKRWGEYLPCWSRMFPTCMLRIFAWIEKNTKPDRAIIEYLNTVKPDVILACPANHRFSEEIEYIKTGMELGIPTAILNYSWDNLTTKGLYHIKPDRLFVWNWSQRNDAIDVHKIPDENIIITGAPFFDKWFDDIEIKETRDQFCKRVGLNPKKPYILYLGSSAKIAPDETAVIESFRGCQVLFRPHPANHSRYNFKNIRTLTPELIDSPSSMVNFLTALRYSRFAFGINNSAMIDAVINGKRCATVVIREYLDTQIKTRHFRGMLPVLAVNGNAQQLSSTEFIKKYIRPCGHAGECVAQHLEGMCEQ